MNIKLFSKLKFNKREDVLILFILFLFFLPGIILAASPITFEEQIDLPGFESGEIGESSIAKYISAFYRWAVIAVAVLAVLMIVNAGFGMILAAGNAAKVVEKRNDLFNAIIGLILVMVAVPMLNMINPALVRLDKLIISQIEKKETKDDEKLPPVSDPSLICQDKLDHACGEVYRQVIEGHEIVCCGIGCSVGFVCVASTAKPEGQICPPGSLIYNYCLRSNAPQCGAGGCSSERKCDQTCCFGTEMIRCTCPEGKTCPCDECDPMVLCQGVNCG